MEKTIFGGEKLIAFLQLKHSLLIDRLLWKNISKNIQKEMKKM